MPPSRLPLEVIEYTIDHLHDDRIALARCSLVSTSWVHASRYHLFYSLKVTGSSDSTHFQDFAQLLSSSIIGQHIRHLHLYNGDFGVPLHGVEIDISLLVSILSYLRPLRTLQFSSIYWRSDTPLATDLRLPTVMGLSFTHFPHKYEMHGIPAILHLFPCLKELRILLDCFGEYPDVTTEELALPPDLRLESLHFWSPLSEPSLIKGLSTTNSLRTLHTISIEVSTVYYVAPIGQLLHHSGSTLKDLTLDISDTDNIQGIAFGTTDKPYSCWEPFGIQHCTSLESFTLNLPVEAGSLNDAWIRATHSWLSYFIQNISSTHLRHIILYLRGVAADIDVFIDIGNWRSFYGGLGNFPELKTVAFFWSAEDWPELQKRGLEVGAVDRLRKLLPEVEKEGRLEFDYVAFAERRRKDLLLSNQDDVPWYGATYRS